MRIKTFKISNFKGISNKEITMKDKTVISGQNGVGKTTISDAWYWLMSGKDTALVDNPTIVPIGMDEVNPTVEAVCDIDGKEITIRKVQKYKNKDGKESTTNQYLVNEVPMTERDFKAKLEEYGIDDKFLVLSHPDYLLRDNSKKGREYVRNEILFPMAQKLSDAKIAEKAGCSELRAKLADYSVQEVEAMNRATLKRINDEIGKDNVIANARIDELSKMKTSVDLKTLSAKADAASANLDAHYIHEKEVKAQIGALKEEIMQLKMDRNAFVSAQNDEISRQKIELDKTLAEKQKAQNQANIEADRLRTLIEVKQETVTANEKRIAYLKEKQKEAKVKKFDKKMTTCPTCGQEYPADKQKEIEANFKAEKETIIRSYDTEIAELTKIVNDRKEEIAKCFADRDMFDKKAKELAKECKAIQKQIDGIKLPDLTNDDGYKSHNQQIIDREKEIEKLESKNFASEEETLRAKLDEAKAECAKAEQNAEIDAKIKSIREDIRQAEINRARAELLLYQIEKLNKAKNEMLEDSINKHFKLVKWKLFRKLKNGEYESACIPTIDGYELANHANHARTVLAKLDVINGLSKFYKRSYPVFLDNAESISETTRDRFDFNGQLIELFVDENKDLIIR